MKKHLTIVLAILIALAFVWTAPAFAKGEEISGVIENIVIKADKNGNEYVRFIVPITQKSESGIEYQESLPFMAFGAQVEEAKAYKTGDTLKVIARSRVYQDRQSYTILKYLE